MSIYQELAIEKGWKKEENERHGNCLVIKMRSTKDDKSIFRYAPNLRDKPFFDMMWAKLEVLDGYHKKRLALITELELNDKKLVLLEKELEGINNKDIVINGKNC